MSDELNEVAIGDFLLFGYNPEPSTTTFCDIQRLQPAHNLTLSQESFHTNRYWRLSNDGHILRYKRGSDYIDHFKDLLCCAVADRLRTARVSIFMSGGLDSTTLAASVCELRAQRSVPIDLRAYCAVYDHYPDDERYYSGLVAEALRIPIHYEAVDNYKLFERWNEYELRRPEPYDAPLAAIDYDLLKASFAHSRVALYGEDGDALLFPASVVDMLRGMQVPEVIADVSRYVFTHRRRPMLGLGILEKARRSIGKQQKDPPYPPWLNHSFAARLDLPARWQWKMKPNSLCAHPVRPTAYRRLTSPYWQSFFESIDPGVTFVPVEHRLPLLDLRLVDYLLAIPPLPWCAGKELLRTAMRGTLPEPVCVRPKTPLTFDAYQVRLQKMDARWMDEFEPSAELSNYIDRAAIPKIAGGNYDAGVSWVHLRPLVLNYWLESRESGRG